MHPQGTSTGRFRKYYGAGPQHLLVLTGCFMLAGYTVLVLGPAKLFNPDVWWQSIAVWFLGGAVFLDLVLLPICATADRALNAALHSRRATRGHRLRVPLMNYIRVPVLASGLLFLVFFPGIIEQGKGSYLAATGQTQEPFLERWLWLTVLFCCLSALLYVVRRGVGRLITIQSTEREHND